MEGMREREIEGKQRGKRGRKQAFLSAITVEESVMSDLADYSIPPGERSS